MQQNAVKCDANHSRREFSRERMEGGGGGGGG